MSELISLTEAQDAARRALKDDLVGMYPAACIKLNVEYKHLASIAKLAFEALHESRKVLLTFEPECDEEASRLRELQNRSADICASIFSIVNQE